MNAVSKCIIIFHATLYTSTDNTNNFKCISINKDPSDRSIIHPFPEVCAGKYNFYKMSNDCNDTIH